MRHLTLLSLVSLATAGSFACGVREAEVPSSIDGIPTLMGAQEHEPIDASALASLTFEQMFLVAARDYENWTQVSDHLGWVILDCTPRPPILRVSTGHDVVTHGNKLYVVFARHYESFIGRHPGRDNEPDLLPNVSPAGTSAGETSADQAFALHTVREPVGQVIVKESWKPVEVALADSNPGDALGSDGRAFRRGEKSDLFIMLKLDPATPNTDEGWVYGTVTPDAKTVGSSGRVARCMKCHVDAPRDRVFSSFAH